jgi:hypothetical protein
MTAPTACNHPDWEWTGTGYKCKTAGCEERAGPALAVFASGSTSPLAKELLAVVIESANVGHVDDRPVTKPDWTLFPWVGAGRALEAVQYGARKYSVGDWRTRYTRAQLMAKVMRHLTADLMGVRMDAESGRPHVACACADLLFLLELEPKEGT